MLPKNSKEYIKPTAEQLGKDPQLVADVVGFYYAELRKVLADLSYHNIQVEELGMFKVKSQKLPGLIAKYTAQLETLRKDSYEHMRIREELTAKRDKAIAVQKLIKEEHKRKEEKRNEKRAWYNMEKPETDS